MLFRIAISVRETYLNNVDNFTSYTIMVIAVRISQHLYHNIHLYQIFQCYVEAICFM